MYINVYKGDDNFVTSGATLLSDLDLQETYRAIEIVATGRIPSLFCDRTYIAFYMVYAANYLPMTYFMG